MENQKFFSSPASFGKMSYFVEFSGKRLLAKIKEMNYEKKVVYFHDKESFDDIICDLHDMAKMYEGEIRLGKGKYLSGLRTIAVLSFKTSSKIYEVECDFGYERDELEIIETMSIGDGARQIVRRRIIENWGLSISDCEKIELSGLSFRYLS